VKVCIFGNPNKPLASRLVDALLPWLKKQVEVKCVELSEHGKLDPTGADFILVVGGDGTILNCARRLTRYDVPVVGINLGRFGFLTAISPLRVKDELLSVFRGEYSVSERMMLEVVGLDGVKLDSGTGDVVALNEIVIEKGGTPRALSIEVHHGDQYFNDFSADGVIVATPTGSTAYSLSAGGPLVAAELGVMVIIPICPHCLSERPFVVSADKPIRLRLSPYVEGGMVTLDGQVVYRPNGETFVEVRRYRHTFKLLSPPNVGQYEVIRNKLNWGKPFTPLATDPATENIKDFDYLLED